MTFIKCHAHVISSWGLRMHSSMWNSDATSAGIRCALLINGNPSRKFDVNKGGQMSQFLDLSARQIFVVACKKPLFVHLER